MSDPRSLPILGRHSARLAEIRRICRGEDPELTAVDGVKLVRDLAAAGVVYEAVLATPDALSVLAPGGGPALACHGTTYLVEPETLARTAPTQHPQGLLAVVRVPRHEPRVARLVVYLDRVQDPGNVGATIRCAAALGAAAVACSAGCADPFSPRAVRASAGQSLLLPVSRAVPFGALADRFVAAGGDVVAAVGSGGVPLAAFHGRAPLLLALGNEGQGLAPEVLEVCTARLTIPLARGVESLNVAVSAGILLASLAGLACTPILESKVWRGGADDPSS